MNCRPISSSDYSTACKWWEGRGFPCLPESVLPPTGCIIEDYCLGYLYLSNGGLCMIEFVVGNPDKHGIELHSAIMTLLRDLVEQAKYAGCTMIFSSVKNKSLIKIMQRVGFNVTEEGMSNLLYT